MNPLDAINNSVRPLTTWIEQTVHRAEHPPSIVDQAKADPQNQLLNGIAKNPLACGVDRFLRVLQQSGRAVESIETGDVQTWRDAWATTQKISQERDSLGRRQNSLQAA